MTPLRLGGMALKRIAESQGRERSQRGATIQLTPDSEVMRKDTDTSLATQGSSEEALASPSSKLQQLDLISAMEASTPRIKNSACDQVGLTTTLVENTMEHLSETEEVTSSSSTSASSVENADPVITAQANHLDDDAEDAATLDQTVDNTVDEEDAKRVQTFEVELLPVGAAAGDEMNGTAEPEEELWNDNHMQTTLLLGDEFDQVVSFDLEELEADAAGGGDVGPSFLSPMVHDKNIQREHSPVSVSDALVVQLAHAGEAIKVVPESDKEAVAHPDTKNNTDESLAAANNDACQGETENEIPVTENLRAVDTVATDDLEGSISKISTHTASEMPPVMMSTPVTSNKKLVSADVVAKSPGRSIDNTIRRRVLAGLGQ